MEKRAKREFTKEFKQQMVMLHSSGKPASEIIREYDLTASAFHNAVAEAQFKIIKTEFVRFRRFENIEHLRTELMAYVYWFNNKRIHGSLGYKSPVEFRQSLL